MATTNLNVPVVNAHLHSPPTTTTSTPKFLSCRFPKTARPLNIKCMVSITSDPVPAEKTSSSVNIGEKWRKIQGEDNWAGMLDPMDPLLRTEIIRYGEMAQACYDGFDQNAFSKFCGSCKVHPTTFFPDLGLGDAGYEITSYIHGSNSSELIPDFFEKAIKPDGPWNPRVNWIGFVAVSNDETTARLGRRDILISWRGTVTKLEGISDMMSFMKPVSSENLASPDPEIKVMAGFLHIYTDKDQSCMYSKFSAREQVLAEVRRLVKVYRQKDEELSISITGHSLGSAVGILCAYDIAESGLDKLDNKRKMPITVFSFSGPRLGNTRFRKRITALGIKVLRVFNVHDKVPTIPGVFLNEKTWSFIEPIADFWVTSFYAHIGEELSLDHMNSPFIKESLGVASLHNLELLLHLIDGYHGKGKNFSLVSGRDKALVNKTDDILKVECLIPPQWAQIENKGLRKNENGHWELPEQEDFEERIRPEDVEAHLRKLGLLD